MTTTRGIEMDTKTADQHRADAQAAEKARSESWDRSDTDGFMSQWASGLSASKSRLAAEIAENHGLDSFPALFDLDGNLVAARLIETRFGWSWALMASDDPWARGSFIGWFNPSQARSEDRRLAANRKKGYTVGRVLAPAKADLAGATATSVRAVSIRTDGGFSREVGIVEIETRWDD
jgi:hypothetical protein